MRDWIEFPAPLFGIQRYVTLFVLAMLVSACNRIHLIPEGGIDMQDVYKGTRSVDSTPGGVDVSAYRLMQDERGDTAHYRRTKDNELEQLFPVIPNPRFEMYIEPHITKSNATVPGYTTGFSLYTRDHYGLPGEVLSK